MTEETDKVLINMNNHLESKFLWHPDITITVNGISKPAPLTWRHLNLYISQFMQIPMPLIKIICSYFGNYDFRTSKDFDKCDISQDNTFICCDLCDTSENREMSVFFKCCTGKKVREGILIPNICICNICWPLMYGENIDMEGLYLIEWIRLNRPHCRIRWLDGFAWDNKWQLFLNFKL